MLNLDKAVEARKLVEVVLSDLTFSGHGLVGRDELEPSKDNLLTLWGILNEICVQAENSV